MGSPFLSRSSFSFFRWVCLLIDLSSSYFGFPRGRAQLPPSLPFPPFSSCSPLSAQVIAKARVPIVKCIEAESGFKFDVSFDVANGPQVWFPSFPRSVLLITRIGLSCSGGGGGGRRGD